MSLPAAHSLNTSFRISICRCDRPKARSSSLMRLLCSSSVGAAAVLPQAQPKHLSPARLSNGRTALDQSCALRAGLGRSARLQTFHHNSKLLSSSEGVYYRRRASNTIIT